LPNQTSRSDSSANPPDSDVSLGAESSSQLLSATQISALKAESERYRSAQRQVTDALGVLWNCQLDMALKMEEPNRIESSLLIGQQKRFYNNCDC
jgi:hypothetical protein